MKFDAIILLGQYALAEQYNLTIVSFDSDFDRAPRGRKEPREWIPPQLTTQMQLPTATAPAPRANHAPTTYRLPTHPSQER